MGGPSDWYVRAPLPLVLLLGPLMGLVFFFTLPLSGMLVLGPFLAGKLRTAVSSGRLSPAHLASGSEPGISYLEPYLRPGVHDSTPAARCDGAEPDNLIDIANEIVEKEWGKS